MYRLKRKSSSRSGRETRKVEDHIRRLATALKGLKFDGADSIRVLNFLSRFVEEADILEMKESQAFLALPYFLEEDAYHQYRAARESSLYESEATAWPEAVQFLLRNYATDSAISESLLELRDIRQRLSEDEAVYSTWLMTAELRCGNFHSTEEKMAMFIDGLISGNRSLVARHREEQREKSRRGNLFTYLDPVRYAQREGEAYRARLPVPVERQKELRVPQSASRTKPLRGKSPPRGRRPQLLLESSEDSRATRPVRYRNGNAGEEVYLTPDDGSIATSQLPSSSETAEASDATMLMQGWPRTFPAPHVPHQEYDRGRRTTRQGWRDTRRESFAKPAGSKTDLVCYSCYLRGHVSPDCGAKAQSEPERVIANFQRLTVDEKNRVPADSLERAQALLEFLNAGMAKLQ